MIKPIKRKLIGYLVYNTKDFKNLICKIYVDFFGNDNFQIMSSNKEISHKSKQKMLKNKIYKNHPALEYNDENLQKLKKMANEYIASEKEKYSKVQEPEDLQSENILIGCVENNDADTFGIEIEVIEEKINHKLTEREKIQLAFFAGKASKNKSKIKNITEYIKSLKEGKNEPHIL